MQKVWVTGAAFLAAVLLGLAVVRPELLRVVVALVIAIAILAIGVRFPPGAVIGALVVWMVALGSVRRVLSLTSPKAVWGDPLLLVSAFALVILTLVALERGALRTRDGLTNTVLLLSGILALSALNPLQGGLKVGLGGAFLVVTPMLGYVVGRGFLGDRLLDRLLLIAAWLGVVVATYGLYQFLFGFPSWDRAWIADGGYLALSVGGTIRSFASFSAASEYAIFLAIALVVWISRLAALRWWGGVLGASSLIAIALWMESSRGIILLSVAALGAMCAAWYRLSIIRALVLAALMVAAVPVVVGWLAPDRVGSDPLAQLHGHQAEGLANPFGEQSTLRLHLALTWEGIKSTFTQPLGHGVGAITISGEKYGGLMGGGEADPGRIPFATGIPGEVTYLVLVVLALSRTYRLAASRRDPVALAALGIVVVTFLQWCNGGNYAAVIWPWLVLGWVSRQRLPEVATTSDSGRRSIPAKAR